MRKLIAFSLSLLISSLSYSALHVRDLDGDWSNGHEGVYDDVLDITWLADADYALTSGYMQPNGVNGDNTAMSWHDANLFAMELSIGVFNNWRLPSRLGFLNPSAYVGSFGHMYYTNFECPWQSQKQWSSCSDDISLFSNFFGADYWYQEIDPPNPHGHDTGILYSMTQGDSHRYPLYPTIATAWPVHDGDIGLAPVPIPAAAWFFGSALIGLLAAKRKPSLNDREG